MLRRGKKNKVEKGRLKKKKKDSSKNEGGSQKQSDQIWRIFSQWAISLLWAVFF
jgi:hypothetical protein